MDNYYTHWKLAKELAKRQTYMVGTMKSNMLAGMPSVVTNAAGPFLRSMKRGDMGFLHNGNVNLTVIPCCYSRLFLTLGVFK